MNDSGEFAGAIGYFAHSAAALIRWLLSRRQPDRRDEAPLRIAVLCDSFIRYGSAQAVGLRAAGVHVVFYYIDRLGEFDGDAGDRQQHLDRVVAAGIEIVPLPRRDLRHLPWQVASLHRDLATRRFDVLVVHQHIDPRYATLGLRFPVAMFLHDPRPHTGDYQSTYPLAVRAMARFAEMTSSCLILHSERLTPQLHTVLRRLPVGFVAHGTDMAPTPAAIRPPPRLALVGRLMEYKGIVDALAAFRSVVSSRPDCTLVVAGVGRLGDQIRAANLPGVDLRDRYVPESEMQALIDGARLVLLPYRDATQSGVGMLAVAHGVPCIVSNEGALPDLVPPGCDWIVPPRDPRALSRAILAALDHGEDTRRRLFDFASERFAWSAVAEDLLRELKRLRVLD